MRQSKIKRVVVHTEGADRTVLAERVSVFHVDTIERYLTDAGLTTAQKMAVIDGIVEQLQRNESVREVTS